MSLLNIVINRLQSTFRQNLDEQAKDEYFKALQEFHYDDLERGMNALMQEHPTSFMPTPAQVRKFVIENQKRGDYSDIDTRNPFEDAQLMVKRADHLKHHDAYNKITPGHAIARRELEKMIKDRAMIKAQVLCDAEAIGYDANVSFGYLTWGGRCKNMKNQISAMRSEAKSSGLIDVVIPLVAIDHFNGLKDYSTKDMTLAQISAYNNLMSRIS